MAFYLEDVDIEEDILGSKSGCASPTKPLLSVSVSRRHAWVWAQRASAYGMSRLWNVCRRLDLKWYTSCEIYLVGIGI